MNAQNIALQSAGMAFIGYAVTMLGKNDLVSLVAVLVGVGLNCLYEYLP